MDELRKCSKCSAPIPSSAYSNHCLPCLLQLGLATQNVACAKPGAPVVTTGTPLLKPGDRVGRYELLEQLGEGGCGIVFMAEQEEPIRRPVALKVIKLGMDTRQGIARFEAERQALALLDHPNIPKVFDAGVTESGRHFFVMEFVHGIKITDYCDREKLSIPDRLLLFKQVCQAVQHAHQKGLIHRDLKPANILVTEEVPGAMGSPKIIDFGIVKSTDQPLTNKPLFTVFQQFMGTPAYVSPEQASMDNQIMDTRSDIYSLGAILFELLTGQAPIDISELQRCSLEEVLRLIREKEPLRPSQQLKRLAPTELKNVAVLRQSDPVKLPLIFKGDLDWIVMKCLEKDRNRRYETAFGLAVEVERYLDCKPISARPASNYYRLQKLVRRNQLAFATAAAVTVVLLTGTAVSVYQAVSAREAARVQEDLRMRAEILQKHAEAEADKNEQVAHFLKDIFKGVGSSVALGRDTVLLREILDRAGQRLDQDLINPEVHAELRNTLSEAYHDLGLYQSMEDMAQKALRISQSIPDRQNVTAADALMHLGDSLMHLGKLNAAETITRQALDLTQKLLGPENPSVSICLNNLGLILRQKGQLGEAEILFRDSLGMDEKLLGREDPRVAVGLGNLGATLWGEGRFPEAESVYSESIHLRQKIFGDENPDLAASFNNLATVLASEGRLAEAEVLNRKALAMDRKFFGEKHPDVAIALSNLGKVLAAEGRVVEAEVVDREAQNINLRGLGGQGEEVVHLRDLGHEARTGDIVLEAPVGPVKPDATPRLTPSLAQSVKSAKPL